MTVESALTFFIAILLFGIAPGVGLFAIIARALSQGALACTSLACGMAMGDVVYLVLACYGLATLAEHYSALFHAIKMIGAGYLIYLAYRLWTDVPQALQKGPVSKTEQAKGILQGFLISSSNPKVILFYIAFLPTFMDLSALTAQDIVLASALTLLAMMIALMSVAAAASWARRYFQSAQAMRGLNRVAGTLMGSAGVYIASRG